MEFIKNNIIIIIIIIVLIYLLFFTELIFKKNIPTKKQNIKNTKNSIVVDGNRGNLIHERILYGLAGQLPITYSTTEKVISMVYNPFGYAVPSKTKNTHRRYRLYAIYSDNMTNIGNHQMKICFNNWGNCNKNVVFTLPRTWGTTSTRPNDWNRDSFSNWINEEQIVSPHHSHIRARTTINGRTGVLRKLVLQVWDFNK